METLTCRIRRKAVAATPEEHVRQALLAALLAQGCPPSLIAVERALTVHGRRKRFDVLVFSRQAQPWLLAECKAPYEALNAATAHQALTYNARFGAPWLVLTNGRHLAVLDFRNPAQPAWRDALPTWP